MARLRFLAPPVVLIALFVTIGCTAPVTPVAACVPAATPRPGATRPPPTATPTISQAAAQADIVFRGRRLRQQDVSYKIIDSPAYRTTFAIETLWKGTPMPEVTVLTYSCGGNANPFATDGTYIIYATQSSSGDFFPFTDVSHRATGNDQEDTVLGAGIIAPAPTIAVAPSLVPSATVAPQLSPTTVPPIAPAVTASAPSNLALLLLAGGVGFVAGGVLVGLMVRHRVRRS